MMKEIGSEFWSVPQVDVNNGLFTQQVSWFASGRFALKAIIKDIKKNKAVKSVGMPSWCCKTMIIPFIEEGLEVKFYSVYVEKGELVQDFKEIKDVDVLLVMNYFGYKRFSFPSFKGIVICDVTHSLFSPGSCDADYVFGSIRKWAGFYTGGFAYSKKGRLETYLTEESEYKKLRETAMEKKRLYIEGQTDSKEYLEFFASAEKLLSRQTDIGASTEDIKKANKLDVDFLKTRRKENAKKLIEGLGEISLFSYVGKDDCPLFVPIIVKKELRDSVRKFLVDEKIFCPVHWPESAVHKLNKKTREIYETEISLVCDQRYSLDDMERIISALKKVL